ncbi:MAG: deoxyribodipyrimidine photo-lyase [Phycisphaerae bacterium]|nr:MAG: deoxyribodipyrimidine photo-lyase [Phycisphaerae bacterium]
MRVMVWFRTDLRTRDHAALFEAARVATRGVVGVFVVSPGEWRAHEWAGAKVAFTLRGVAALRSSLEKLNIPLRIVRSETPGEIPDVLAGLARETACDALYATIEHEVNERRRDAMVKSSFERAGVRTAWFEGQTLVTPGSVRTGAGTPYTVFTPFKRSLLARWEAEGWPLMSGLPRQQEAMVCTPSPVPKVEEGFDSSVPAKLWPGGEDEARRRLGAFLSDRVGNYDTARDRPDVEGTSALSPYLALGMISPRECVAAAHRAVPRGSESIPTGVATWISEVIWREFYLHVLAAFPRVCMGRAFDVSTERVAWREDPAGLEAWQEGRTGVPIVDAGMRQLRATGWMHNRVRMITASFLTKNLLIDWRRGESWFMRNLVDGFFASNNGGWQWCASTGTDAAPYFRVFNPVNQGKRFDPDGTYVRRWVPELAAFDASVIHEPWTLLPLTRAGVEYPEPIVDLSTSRVRAIEAFRTAREGGGSR